MALTYVTFATIVTILFLIGIMIGSLIDSKYYDKEAATYIVAEMRYNSSKWLTNNQIGHVQLSAKDQELGYILRNFGVNALYDATTGIWYVDKIGGKHLYNEY